MDKEFFNNDGLYVAKNILGKFLIRKYNNMQVVTRIVETEAYMGKRDKASHVYSDKKTKRTKPLYLKIIHLPSVLAIKHLQRFLLQHKHNVFNLYWKSIFI